jgi:two-component system C4-dicarboxylate transport sensor histidine kinase DctB
VVAKVEVASLEAEWRGPESVTLVGDERGIVLITSKPEWRFKTWRQLSAPERVRLTAGHQFGDAAFATLPLRPLGKDGVVDEISLGEDRPPSYVQATAQVAPLGWTLRLLLPVDATLRSRVLPAQIAIFLLAAGLIVGFGALLRRLELQSLRAEERERARADLEERVRARTAELEDVNQRLLVEMEERRRAEALQQTLQDNLVQASKLAVLGQIAAGVAHEINQPVAAIRTYADTAVVLLDRDRADQARTNLSTIAGLTDRIGRITEDLREFSRKARREIYPVPLADAVGGAVRLAGSRLRAGRLRLVRDEIPPSLKVIAEPTRLEQVLVNLLQNAIEALDGCAAPTIRLQVEADEGEVRVVISDNGPGLEPKMAAELFTPFATTKPNGLGLGLVISRDIMREFGGDLRAESGEGGAAFVMHLRRSV